MTLLYFLLLVGVLVLVHELGHLVVARLCGVRVSTFSLGFGPKIFAFQIGATELRLSAIPLGGYVRLLAEPSRRPDDSEKGRSFAEKPLWQRVAILLAGPAANLLLAFALYFSLYATHSQLRAPVVGTVFSGHEAERAGLQAGDRITAIDGEEVTYWDQVERKLSLRVGHTTRLRVQRGATEHDLFVSPQAHIVRDRFGHAQEVGWIGIAQQTARPIVGIVQENSAASRAGLRTGDVITAVDNHAVGSFSDVIERLRSPGGLPHNIAYLRPEIAQWGFADLRTYRAGVTTIWPEGKAAGAKLTYDDGLRSAELFVASVEAGSPAEAAGIRPGDLLVALDGALLTHWFLLEDTLLAAPDKPFRLRWKTSQGELREATIIQQTRRSRDEFKQSRQRLVFGAQSAGRAAPATMERLHAPMSYAFRKALGRTTHTASALISGVASLLTGSSPRDQLGGPLMLYELTQVTANKGMTTFMLMMALVSINLALINLLPIPQLDGGQILQTVITSIRQRPLTARTRDAARMVGVAVIVFVLVLALKNDFMRYLAE